MATIVALSTLLCVTLASAPVSAGAVEPSELQLSLALPGAGAGLAAAPRLALAVEGPGAADEAPPLAAPVEPGRDARSQELRWWGRTLRWSTAAALVATSTLGTMAAINQPTRFGDGRCITGRPVLGEYGCDRGLSTLHGSSAVLSVTLYTANAVLGLAAPASRGIVAPSARPVHRVLSWVHLAGMVVQPVIGLVSAFPQVIGKSRTVSTDELPRNLRTVHVFVGYVTTAAFLTTTVLER